MTSKPRRRRATGSDRVVNAIRAVLICHYGRAVKSPLSPWTHCMELVNSDSQLSSCYEASECIAAHRAVEKPCRVPLEHAAQLASRLWGEPWLVERWQLWSECREPGTLQSGYLSSIDNSLWMVAFHLAGWSVSADVYGICTANGVKSALSELAAVAPSPFAPFGFCDGDPFEQDQPF